MLVDLLSGAGRSLVFARTKRGVAKLASDLSRAGVPALELHGDLNQSMRQRNLSAFSEGRVRVLVATDIAARGIHVDDVALVVHSDPPAEPKAFLHRSGRTARAGASGIVVTLCQQDQNRKVRAMMAAAGIGNARREVVSPGGDLIAEVRGERAAPQAYVPEPVVDHRFDPKRPRHAQGQRGGRPFGNARGATKARAQLGTGAWGKPAPAAGTDSAARAAAARRPVTARYRNLPETKDTCVKHGAPNLSKVSLLFRDYAGTPKAFDEVVGAEGVRVAYGSVLRQLAKLDGDEVRARAEYLKSTYLDQGVTFDIGGEERPFPLDIVPRVLLADEWAEVEAGVAQRVRALEAFLADVYGEGRVFGDGVVPAQGRRQLAALPPGDGGRAPAERRPLPRRRHRPGPRRGRPLPGAGGQRPGAVRGVLRDDEPARDVLRAARGDQPAPDPSGGGLPAAAAGRAAGGGAAAASATRPSSC